MKVAAIINPVSGAGADARIVDWRVALLREELAEHGVGGEIHLTERAGHARELASAAARADVDLLLVWGGDGTVNEAGAALLGTPTALGVIPAGSGNGLAAALCCPRDPRRAVRAALTGRTRAIDAGMLDSRPFFNIAGIGVDARIARLFNLRSRGSRGLWPYVLLGIREGLRYSGLEYEVELDGANAPVRALLIAFANGREYGNGMTLCAGAAGAHAQGASSTRAEHGTDGVSRGRGVRHGRGLDFGGGPPGGPQGEGLTRPGGDDD